MKREPKQYFFFLRRKLAKIWLDINSQLTVIGVTGSYGKTSSVYAVTKVLSGKYSVVRTDLNLDTNFNLPITLLKVKLWTEMLVLEYGIDHRGEMDDHLRLVKPKIAVLTGISPVHTDKEHLGSLENLINEKKKLVETVLEDGLALFNLDDEKVREIAKEHKGRKILYGISHEADVWANNIAITPDGTRFSVNVGDKEVKVETGLLGYPAVYSCLVAYIVGKELKVEEDKILVGLKMLKPLEGRFNIEKGPLGTELVNDSRRANLASTIVGLRSFTQLPGRKVGVLGEMGEIGEREEELHREVGKEVARLKLDTVVGVGSLTKYIIEEAEKSGMKKSQLYWADDVQKAADILKNIVKKGDLLYLKASLLKHLERVIILLDGKKICCNRSNCQRYKRCYTCPLLTECVK